jgi:hypothetical protein
MKNVLLLSFSVIFLTGLSTREYCEHHFSVKVWDRNFSMGYAILYKIDSDSLTVKSMSGDEKDKMLMKEALSEAQCQIMWHFLSTHNIDSFSTEYNNPSVQDGDRKRIEFKVEDKSKTVDIANFYQKDMDELFGIINRMVNKDLQIYYKRPG